MSYRESSFVRLCFSVDPGSGPSPLAIFSLIREITSSRNCISLCKFVIILSPVGAYYPEGVNPVKIYVSDFRESCIDIGIRYWVRTEDYWDSRWRVLEKIKYAFDEAGVTIPFNQLDVNVITDK